MWYVIQVFTGEEEEIVQKCRRIIGLQNGEGAVLQKCFLPYVIRKKKYLGEWHDERKILFPGYVFLVSDQPRELYLQLRKVPGLTKLLGTDQEIVPLAPEEEAFLKRLGGEEQVVEFSYGIMEGNQVTVIEGALMGLEGCIRKIDRHKRTAWIEINMMGRVIETQVGIETIKKSDCEINEEFLEK